MKKTTVLLLFIMGFAFGQLRVGFDVNRETKISIESISLKQKPEGMGINIGYEQTLFFEMIGVGVEYVHSTVTELEDSDDEFFEDDEGEEKSAMASLVSGYAVAKIPLGPMFKGVARLGMSLPLEEGFGAGLMYGAGVRVKPPVFPIGFEFIYSIHDLKPEDGDMGDLKYTYNRMNLSMTYSF